MVEIATKSGKVSGIEHDDVHSFLGIPYAAAPVGSLRFKPPAPVAPWDGARPSRVGDVVRQGDSPGVFGDLFRPPNPQGTDCLNLNVWTPDPGATGLPVLVWIHGGAFTIGSGSDPIYNGASFARGGVVLVTVNYRLGVDGFLHVGPDVEGSGNFGMLDQIAALEWVRDNIAAFGGNPNRVTIAGESAGGMSVGTLMAMPAARGLFQRAIPQSGAGHNGIATESASVVTAEIMKALGLDRNDFAGLIDKPIEQVHAAQNAVADELTATMDVEKWGEVATRGARMAFQPLIGLDDLPKRPIEAIGAGSAANVELLVGCTAEEFLLFVGLAPELMGIDDSMVDVMFGAIFGMAGKDGAAALEMYRSHRPGATALELLAALETDRVFRIPAIRLAEAQVEHQRNVWMYNFAWRSPAFEGRIGAGHATEIPFVFNNLDDEMGQKLIGTTAPQQLADVIHAAWTGFVTEGDPGHSNLPAWPRYETGERQTMLFDDGANELVADPASEERQLWTGVL